MTAHRHDWMMSDRPDVLECADCGACCTWDPSDRSTHPDAHMPADPLDAGVLSSDAPVVLSPADADRVAALIEERPGPTEAMRALFAERRPCAGWGDPDAYGDRMLRTGDGPRWILGASMRGGWAVTSLSLDRDGAPCWTVVAQGESPTIDAAMIAAEDSLRAIAAEILRAVGA